ncbi:EAL domain-containing protein [Altererythrobacter sp. Root672]|uniref:EAL domain-containing protein n=1 Tax=Altererythrobacter sp. Root672 TaxID=1736584 RepID=UPI001F389943|nr:EAL domain-containing protein [Altererythrobacter sp. Root672]
MIAAIGACSFWVGSAPHVTEAIMLALSVFGAAGVGIVHSLIAGRRREVKVAGVLAVVVAPMFLFGLAITRWSVSGQLPWDFAIASLLCVAGASSAYLRQHPVVFFAAKLSIWAAAVAANASLAGALTVLAALIGAILVSRELMREQRTEDERMRARERVQTRAGDILADYEQTRQGWFWETDRRGQLTYVSAPVAEAVGCTAEELVGLPLVTLFDLDDTSQESERTLLFHLNARSAFQELTVRAAIKDEERWWSVSGRPIHNEYGNFVGFRGSGVDLTAKKLSEDHASRLAHYDSLTGLANRFQMSQALEKTLTSRQRANRACSVMLIDLDRFKQVNDTMGHPAGDALLKQVARRLEAAVDKMGQVGRLGGDEFQVIVPGRIARNDVSELASHIIHSLSQPYSIEGQRVVIGASIGIAVSPEDGVTNDEVIRNADLALYAAKDLGRGRFHFYANDLHAEAEARSQLEQDLRDAITEGQLQLYYQPVVSSATEKLTGFEALLRWEHPQRGWVPTDKFVKIAEDTGLIAQIGEWALRTACHELARWPEEVRVAVNISPLQFANPQLPSLVANAIAQAGVHPSRLELEITESVFLNDDTCTDTMFAALKGLGVRLALDDFGTGYSSLGYLKKAPFDKIKIDQSFVRGATLPGSRNGAIIASITSLAHALGMDTTAEGVETLDELELVRMHGCSHIQGFIYGRPLSATDATERVKDGLTVEAKGPRASRAPRQTMLRKVVLDHDGQVYQGKIRNVSDTGALIEGLWHVPPGTTFTIEMSDSQTVRATSKWSAEDRMGVEFAVPLAKNSSRAKGAKKGRQARSAAVSY